MVKKFRIIITFALTIFFTLFLINRNISAEEALIYDLPLCINHALKNHPFLLQSQHMINYYQEGVKFEKNLYKPTVSFHTSLTQFESDRNSTNILSVPAGNITTTEDSGTNYVAGFTLTQPLYSKGSFLGLYAPSIEREKSNLEFQKITHEQLKEDIIYEVINLYGQILKINSYIKVKETNLQTSNLFYTDALSKYRLNLINKTDLLKAEAQLSYSKVQLNEANFQLQKNLSLLSNKIGNKLNNNFLSNDFENFKTTLCKDELNYSLEQLYKIASQKRKDLHAQKEKVESQKNYLDLIKSKSYPEINFNANYYYVENLKSNNEADVWNILLRFDLPLLDFGKNAAQKSQYQNLVNYENEILTSLQIDINSEILTTYQKIQNLKLNLEYLQINLKQAKQQLILSKQKFQKKMISTLDLMIAQDNFNEANQKILETEIELIISQSELRKLIGLNMICPNNFKNDTSKAKTTKHLKAASKN